MSTCTSLNRPSRKIIFAGLLMIGLLFVVYRFKVIENIGDQTIPIIEDTQDRSGSHHTDLWKTYCLSTPEHCLNEYECVDFRNIDKEWNACFDSLKMDEDCLVYSIGIADDWSFDQKMGEYGCEVHSFDPTVTLPQNLAPNVTFHQWGLKGSRKDGLAQNFSHPFYGKITGEMMYLGEIIRKLGHENRNISLFKMDCEGCEWEVYSSKENYEYFCSQIQQIITEFHFSTTLGVKSTKQLPMIGGTYDLFNECGYQKFFFHSHNGFKVDQKIIPEILNGAHYEPNNSCCREVGFYRQYYN